MSETTKQFKKQIPRNAVMAFLSFFTYTLTAIWLTPYLVKHLGAAAYSLVPLAGLLTQYVTIITAELSKSVNRFLTVEIQKVGGEPNAVFNSSLFLYIILIILQVPVFSLAVGYAEHLFTIPEEFVLDAKLLFGFSAGAFLISLLGAVFGVSLFATNRLDIGNTMLLLRRLASLVLIVMCFSIWGPGLRFIGYVEFGLQIMMFGWSVYNWRRLTPELRLDIGQIHFKNLKPIFRMSSWTLINRLGTLLYLRSDVWIINRFISPDAAGRYAAVLVVANFIRQLSSQVSGQLAPAIMTFWAKEDLNGLRRLLTFSVKILAVGLSIPVTFLCVNGGDVLGLWLGPDYARNAWLLVVLVIHTPINTGILPLFTLFIASNSVKIPALVTLVMGIINVAASYYLGVVMEMGMLGVALATAVVLTLKNACFTSVYSAVILKIKYREFLWPICWGMFMLGVITLLSYIPVSAMLGLNPSSLNGLMAEGMFLTLCGVILAWVFFVSKREKQTLMEMVPAPIRTLLGRVVSVGSVR